MIRLPKHKRGSTFLQAITLTDLLDVPINGLLPFLKAQVRDDQERLISDLTIYEVGNGNYTLQCTDTKHWPIEILFMDVEYDDGLGNSDSTDTFQIPVIKDVTYNG